jgi:hypothetical protein
LIALDTNILVYAHREESPFHERAREQVVGLAESGAWALPWPCVHEFLAIVTHPRIFRTPTPLELAVGMIEALLESPGLTLLGESEGYWKVFRRLVEAGRISGPAVHDARIAALCVAAGVRELWTADRDFSRFPDLAVRNPLVG